MDRTHPKFQQWAWAAGLLPFAVAMVVHFAIPSQPRAFEVPPRPALAFDQYLVDLGRIPAGPETQAKFVFRNRGTQTVNITGVQPSCGCLQPHVSARVLASGEMGRITLRMQPANETPGRKEFFADVKYTDPQPRQVRLTFKLVIPEVGLSVQPRALLVYPNGDRPIHKQIIITDTRPKPARVMHASASSSLVQVSVGDRQITRSGTVEQALDVEIAGDAPPGTHHVLLTIHTDDPDTPLVRVPVRIERQPATAEPNEP